MKFVFLFVVVTLASFNCFAISPCYDKMPNPCTLSKQTLTILPNEDILMGKSKSEDCPSCLDQPLGFESLISVDACGRHAFVLISAETTLLQAFVIYAQVSQQLCAMN